MKLVIHDLDPNKWDLIRDSYQDCEVISDNGTIRPCNGCFSCWDRTPGQCVIKDGYQYMGKKIHDAEEVIVISHYTYGGFSGFVKNVFDRSLGYVLPQFEFVNGESHHRKRYNENKPFTFIFYGSKLSEEQKRNAERYVKAVCANVRSHVKEVIFNESEEETENRTDGKYTGKGKTVLLLASQRPVKGNSATLAAKLAAYMNTETETVALAGYLNNMSALVEKLKEAPRIVICTPLYVDGLPSQLIRLLEVFQQEYQGCPKKIYLLANMGLYEESQLVNLFEAVKQWCGVMKFEYAGGLGVTAGEVIGVVMKQIPLKAGPALNVYRALKRLADAIDLETDIDDMFVRPLMISGKMFVKIADASWDINAKKNGLKREDLFRQL